MSRHATSHRKFARVTTRSNCIGARIVDDASARSRSLSQIYTLYKIFRRGNRATIALFVLVATLLANYATAQTFRVDMHCNEAYKVDVGAVLVGDTLVDTVLLVNHLNNRDSLWSVQGETSEI